MSSCLEATRLLEITNGRADPEGEVHVLECASCRADLQVMQLLPDAVHARELRVPEELNASTLERIRALAGSEALTPPRHVALTGILGALACFGALMVTGSAGAGTLTDLILFSTSVGVGFGIAAAWPRSRRAEDWFGHASPEA